MRFTPETLNGSAAFRRLNGLDKVTEAKGPGVKLEADLHDSILDHCRAKGWPVVHSRMDRPATCGVGTPDFAIAMPGGVTLWIEAKAAKGKQTPAQLAWMAALRRVGHRFVLARSMGDVLEAIASALHGQ